MKTIKNPWFWLLGILSLALIIRAFWSLLAPSYDPYLRDGPLQGDAVGYVQLARNLINGNGFSWEGKEPTSYRMPGYPGFLAFIFVIVGENLAAVRMIQSILGALTILPVFFIAKSLGGNPVALLSALGVALYPLLIYQTGWVYSETLFIFLLWVGVYLLIIGLEKEKTLVGVLAGLVFGLATIVRPEIAFFPLLICLFVLIYRWGRTRLLIAVAAQVSLALVVLPWSVRNTIINQQFIPLTTSSGSNFYAGNNPDSHGGSAWVYPLEDMSEFESDRELNRRAIQWIRENPTDAFVTFLQKLQKFFSPVTFETRDAPIIGWAWVIDLLFLLFLILAGWGMWKTHRKIPAMVLISLIAWYVLIALIFYGGSRVALPVTPVVIIFAAYSLTAWMKKLPAIPTGAAPSSAEIP
jgi:4-amino-4-deoxy-L-arabinose transferase-like glycosyltransferase